MENNFMNEVNSLPELVLENGEIAIFCRKCGNKLIADINVCNKCGTEVIKQESDTQEGEIPFNNEEYEASKSSLKKKKLKKLLIILGTILFVAILTVAGVFFSKFIVKPQDINTINGCPEFYNVEFRMTVDEASSLIKLEHNAIEGLDESTVDYFDMDESTKDSFIYLDEEVIFYLFGRKTTGVFVGFDKKYLDCVIFNFSLDDYKLTDIVALYEKIYGEPTETGATFATWVGPKTTIDVFKYVSDGEKEIVVRYDMTLNGQYENLSFNGSKIDPCGFLSENYAFNKSLEYYIGGLIEDTDYIKKEYDVFTQYTLFPEFEYMGIPESYTGIEFNVDDERISTVSYVLLIHEDYVVDRIDYIKSSLEGAYGNFKTCDYTSTNYKDNILMKSITFEELKGFAENKTQGIYHVQWEAAGYRITLTLTIDDEEFYESSVTFAELRSEQNEV